MFSSNKSSTPGSRPDSLLDRRPRTPGFAPAGAVPGLRSDAVASASTESQIKEEKPVEARISETRTENTATAAVSATAATATATEATNRLLVGPEVKLKGAEILDCDTLVVEGRVEATMDSRVILIAERGAFAGKVSIDVAEIHGSFEGELTVRDQLIIHATGRVKGKVRYGKLVVESGATLSGDVETLAAETRKEEPRKLQTLLASAAG
ncbi:polymer-forming cytoskeletal protein [Niveibacterium sp. SC-1]|uniref:bactofilin family protein n=1 Tax=Niveibacterium sp. SC-1 TaxID=3135646 RepID=UPI00311FBB5B